MKSAEAIRAEIAFLQTQLSHAEEHPELTAGNTYYLPIGIAEVVGFYEEEGVSKVRARICPTLPADGVTPYADRDEALMSMPIPKFLGLIQQAKRDQQIRDTLERQKNKLNKPIRPKQPERSA